jgi:hypothetical protein
MPYTRRRFLATTATGLAAMSAFPSWAAAPSTKTGCDYLDEISAHWDQHIRPMMAERYHRMHHVLFHYLRNNWGGLRDDQKNDITSIDGGRWVPLRPSLDRAKWDTRPDRKALFWHTSNGSGEDFLWFHRWMIKSVDDMLAPFGVSIQPWSDRDEIPSPKRGCDDEAVPEFYPRFWDPKTKTASDGPEWLTVRVRQMKSDAFYWSKMVWWGHENRDHGYLEKTTLGELGSRLELGVHNQMHIRWSAWPSIGWHYLRDDADFSDKWDNPRYDTLFDEYSSHVTPIFFRLHKWIDNRINDWAEAHGLEQEMTPLGFPWPKYDGKWVQVDKPWTGAFGYDNPDAATKKARLALMEQVAPILSRPAPKAKTLRLPHEKREEREDRIISLRDMVE